MKATEKLFKAIDSQKITEEQKDLLNDLLQDVCSEINDLEHDLKTTEKERDKFEEDYEAEVDERIEVEDELNILKESSVVPETLLDEFKLKSLKYLYYNANLEQIETCCQIIN